MRRWTQARTRALFRHHGPRSLIFRRRVAMVGGAISIGLIALLFADVSDRANLSFIALYREHPYVPVALTPLGFAVLVWLTRRTAPDARGSGIPQVIAAGADPDGAMRSAVEHALLSVVRRGVAADSVESVTSAHIVETGLGLMQRSPALARRVDRRECGVVCATFSPADRKIRVHATLGAVDETNGVLVEVV